MEINRNEGKILVVDDSVINIELLSDILQDNYEVLFATSGHKALKMIPELHPDLILLDIVMPGMDGYEVISILKNNPKTEHIPIIFITAKSTTEDMVKGFKMRAVDYISKPFAVEEVKVRVKTHIDNQLLFKALKKANRQLQQLSRVDGLTGIANRRHFDEFLQQMINRARRHQHPLSLLIIDIDFFKFYNDFYGHQQGDSCLIDVAKQLNLYAQRDGELAARYGGEEFAIILSEMSPEDALEHAQKCLLSIEALQIEHKKSDCNSFVTISMGAVTQIDCSKITPENLIKKADKALYKAKQSGRNQLQV
jgi:diguanylate cyclase (GGDEF)-like protein